MVTGLKSSKDVGFLTLGGRNILGRVTALDDTEEAVLEEITPLGVADDSWAPVGQTKWSMKQSGFYDSAVAGGLSELAWGSGVKQNLMLAITGNAIGEEFMGVEAVRTTYQKTGARGQLTKANAAFVSDGGPDRGLVGAELVARTLVGPTKLATVDFGVAYAVQATGQLAAYLAVTGLNLDGGTGLLVKVYASSDDASYADAQDFDPVVGAVVGATWSQRKVLAASAGPGGHLDRYMKVEYTFTGSAGANRSATFAVGLSRQL